MAEFKIEKQWVGDGHPTYFIADISANHDGQLSRAKKLIRIAKQAGADGAKFQHFRAPKIVSDYGFKALGRQLSHQSKWKKSVFEVYQDASLPWEWTEELKATCDEEGIHFFSSPYDFEAVDMLDPYVGVYKIGSGDVNWPEMLRHIAKKGKPVVLATGASTLKDVDHSVQEILKINKKLAIMQCNTNYTGSLDNFNHIHLNVLKTFRKRYPKLILGLSDHTPGCSTVLGSVALGSRMIEKHFTDDNQRVGPDHPFSMTPATWREMVDRTRELEKALGSEKKTIVENETDTVVLQRRCLRAAANLPAGIRLTREHIDVLRPATPGAMMPAEIQKLIGKRLLKPLKYGEAFTRKLIH